MFPGSLCCFGIATVRANAWLSASVSWMPQYEIDEVNAPAFPFCIDRVQLLRPHYRTPWALRRDWLGFVPSIEWIPSLVFRVRAAAWWFFQSGTVRLVRRPIVRLVMLLLPLAHDRLSFIKSLSIIVCLIAFCVMWEIATSLQCGVKICEPWTER